MIRATMAVTKPCPYRDETDHGAVRIEWPHDAPELHTLAEQIIALGATAATHEDYTRAIAALCPGAQVRTAWQTGPWTVTCTEA